MTQPQVQSDGKTFTIHDPDRYPGFRQQWLERAWWQQENARTHSITGRGSVLMLDRPEETWVYRHYHRGGLVSRLIYDVYAWTGVERTRPFREWRLLTRLASLGLPSPRPVAARAVRRGLVYRADIVTVLLPETEPLSSSLGELWQALDLWQAIGHMIGRFHAAGCDHPDLTAHNVLINTEQEPFLVDFDNACIKPPGSWSESGMQRFKRSLQKVSLETGTDFNETAWQAVTAGYRQEST